jgi:hypothetical protein
MAEVWGAFSTQDNIEKVMLRYVEMLRDLLMALSTFH